MPVLEALDFVAHEAPSEVREHLKLMRASMAAGKFMARGLASAGAPGWVWGLLLGAEQRGASIQALDQIADRLEAEKDLPATADPQLGSIAVALGRLGLMLELEVPILTALERAAEAVPNEEAQAAFFGVHEEVRHGADLSDALARAAPGLPPLTVEMIRDAERDARLPQALSVVADYILDTASE
jgi:type II secretory pathway component PulF